MVEVKRRDGKSDEARIAARLKPSNVPAGVTNAYAQHGTGPTRTVTTTHRAGGQGHHEQGRSRSLTEMPIIPTGGGSILGQKE
jgi:hypothetical protein